MRELLDKFIEQKKLRTEGERGFEALCMIARALGYKDSMYRMQINRDCSVGDLMDFFADNSGAVEAVINWIVNADLPEWRESLESHLDPEPQDMITEVEDKPEDPAASSYTDPERER